MDTNRNNYLLFISLLFTLVMPVFIGFILHNNFIFKYSSLPLHSFLEASGAVIAIVLAVAIFTLNSTKLHFSRHHKIAFGLIVMGVFDAFHALVGFGDLFVWFHSLSIFFGGLIFCFVWTDKIEVTDKTYKLTPIFIFSSVISISFATLLFSDFVPQMLNDDGEFTRFANFLNITGGILFILSSLYFIKRYTENLGQNDLIYASLTMLFGVSGTLFVYSELLDMQWWFWHFVRFAAYLLASYFMFKIFAKTHLKIVNKNIEFENINAKLLNSAKILNEYKRAVDLGTIVSIGDLNGIIKYANEEFIKSSGYSEEELIGRPHNLLRHPETPKTVFKEMWSDISNKKCWKGLVKNRAKDGTSFYVKLTVVPVLDEDDNIFEYIGIREDVTELVKSQKELKEMFFTDSLTSLSNRFRLLEDLRHCEHPFIGILNINDFKQINDFYGDKIGDAVLINLANLLVDYSYAHNYKLYRNHADEFVLLCDKDEADEVFINNLRQIITRENNTHFDVDSNEIHIGISAGVSFDKQDIIYADLALKEAKKENRSLVIYNENLNIRQVLENNMIWNKKIKIALDSNKIKIALQPIIDIFSNQITKYEALVRLIDEDGNVISPAVFLPIAKQTRLYLEITKRVTKQVFEALNELDCAVSLNITAADIVDEDTRRFILNQIKQSKHSNRLIIELVESEGIETFDVVNEFLKEIKGHGCKIAIDDFGTGYSNFEYLIKLNVDYIKIDGSMIKNLYIDANTFNVVQTIVEFAKKQSLQVVAEFVSNQNIFDTVKSLDIDFAQGYFIDEPRLWTKK